MDPKSIRFEQYQGRLDADMNSFLFDIRLWRDKLPAQTHIQHHVSQFHDFCLQAIECLEGEYEKKGPSEAKDKKLTFRSSIVGALSAQWAALRQVGEQRLPGHPYHARLMELDRIAADYYLRVRKAVPESVRTKISESPPLTYLGHGAKLTLVQLGMPSLLGVPFGAINTDNPYSVELTENTIPHEVAHAVLNQIPNFFCQLEFRLQQLLMQNINVADPSDLPSSLPENQRKILHNVFRKWLNEILADLVGTVLGGEKFVKSALKVMVAPDEAVALGEADHPISIIRPYIHYEAMRSLLKVRDVADSANPVLKELKDLIDRTSGDYIRQLFHSSNDLTVIPLKAVRDELGWVVRQLLGINMDALGGTLEEFLKSCSKQEAGDGAVRVENLPQWGAEGSIKCDGLALHLLTPIGTQHSTPYTFPYDACCLIGWTWCCV